MVTAAHQQIKLMPLVKYIHDIVIYDYHTKQFKVHFKPYNIDIFSLTHSCTKFKSPCWHNRLDNQLPRFMIQSY